MQQKSTLSRVLRAEQITSTVRPLSQPLTFSVPSQSDADKSYTVNLTDGTCTCPDHQFRGVACKHILAALRSQAQSVAVICSGTQLQREPRRYANYEALFAALAK